MAKRRKILIAAAVLISVAALVLRYGPNFGFYLIPPTPKQYVAQAMSFADRGIYAGGGEWSGARSEAIRKAADCRSYEETYPVIQEALKVAGGKHSAGRGRSDPGSSGVRTGKRDPHASPSSLFPGQREE